MDSILPSPGVLARAGVAGEAAPTQPQARSGPVSVIVNAKAGDSRAQQTLERLRERCSALGLAAEITPVGDGAQIVAHARRAVQAGARMVVAGGGDGTVSAVASCVAGTDTVLGVLPLGTLNHFAKDLGIPLDLDAAALVIATGRAVAVDVAEVNGHVFVNNSSLGLYPHIVQRREQQRRRLGRGKWAALVVATLDVLRRNRALSVEIDVNGRRMHRRTPFLFVGNNEYRMEGFYVGERPSIAQGRLSLYTTRSEHRRALLILALRALFGRLEQAQDFEALTASSFVVRTRRPLVRVATDGEVQLMQSPLAYRIRPGALRVMVPARAPA